jgi:succinate dehydrogenase flavin-adding protein (antitoxin of CptAB toxin-antitoxin module)
MASPIKLNAEQLPKPLADFEAWRRKLLFLCKRGNLESELLLITFVETLNLQISPEKNHLFETLLGENDQNLLCWLLKHNPQAPSEKLEIPCEYQALIEEIRLNYLK